MLLYEHTIRRVIREAIAKRILLEAEEDEDAADPTNDEKKLERLQAAVNAAKANLDNIRRTGYNLNGQMADKNMETDAEAKLSKADAELKRYSSYLMSKEQKQMKDKDRKKKRRGSSRRSKKRDLIKRLQILMGIPKKERNGRWDRSNAKMMNAAWAKQVDKALKNKLLDVKEDSEVVSQIKTNWSAGSKFLKGYPGNVAGVLKFVENVAKNKKIERAKDPKTGKAKETKKDTTQAKEKAVAKFKTKIRFEAGKLSPNEETLLQGAVRDNIELIESVGQVIVRRQALRDKATVTYKLKGGNNDKFAKAVVKQFMAQVNLQNLDKTKVYPAMKHVITITHAPGSVGAKRQLRGES